MVCTSCKKSVAIECYRVHLKEHIYLLANLSALLGPKKVHSGVSITLLANLAAESKGGEGSSVETTLVEVANIDLHTAMVLGSDELVSPRTFAGNVKVHDLASVVLHDA